MRGSHSISPAWSWLLLAVLSLISSPRAEATILSSSPDWAVGEGELSNYFGYHVNTAGDVDGDGYSDVIVACPALNNGDGGAFVYCGRPYGLSPTACWQVEGWQPDRQFGYNVATAGDVNGDGFADIIVGAWGYEYEQPLEGAAFV